MFPSCSPGQMVLSILVYKYHMVGSSSKKHVVLVLYFVHTYFVHTRTHIEIQASTKALI